MVAFPSVPQDISGRQITESRQPLALRSEAPEPNIAGTAFAIGGNRVSAGAEVEVTIRDNRKPLISRLGNRGQPGNSSLSTPSGPTYGAGNSGKSGAAVRRS